MSQRSAWQSVDPPAVAAPFAVALAPFAVALAAFAVALAAFAAFAVALAAALALCPAVLSLSLLVVGQGQIENWEEAQRLAPCCEPMCHRWVLVPCGKT